MGILDRLFGVSGRTAIVTGASSGLGVAFAKGFLEAGMNVVLAARRTDRLGELATELSESGGGVEVATCDVTDSSQIAAMVRQTLTRFGSIDVLVNNAGTSDGRREIEDVSEDTWDSVMDLNLKAIFFMTQAFLPFLRV